MAPASSPASPICTGALVRAWLLVALMAAGCTKTEAPERRAPETSSKTTSAEKAAPAHAASAAKLARQPGQFHVDFGRRDAAGTTLKGWKKHNDAGRDIAQLTQATASIRFELSALGEDYVLMGVARAQGAKPSTLTPTLNGHALQAWPLTKAWAMYVSPVPPQALTATPAELVLATNGAQPGDSNVDALALVPVAERATIEMNGQGPGLPIDGFYGHEGGALRWSRGDQSLLGVVLHPSQGPHRLSARGTAFPPLAPLGVKLAVNGKDLGPAIFEGKGSDVRWDVPAGALRDGLNLVELAYAKTGKPSAFGKSKDSRDIAVRFARLTIEPR